jgi:beta-lactamase superfamily II metal-dependent hydrolase
MKTARALLLLLFVPVLFAASETLEIYFIDVEGGQATLIVTPAGQSMLVDAGWPGFEGRDAERIVKTARQAGLQQIDYMLVTHYHTDHVGGVPQLAGRIPIVNFVDHGDNTETGPNAEKLNAAYYAVRAQGKHIVVKAGDKIPLRGADVQVVCARGEVIAKALPGGGKANPLCASAERKKDDPTENARSVGIVLRFGQFSFIDLGDITWNTELALACPSNKIGPVDVYLTTHHGLDASNAPQLVQALAPRVAIMNNGAKKGGSPGAWKVIQSSPGLEGFWQLHYALAGGPEHNVAEKYIANMSAEGCGQGLRLAARQDGSFTVTNERTGYQEHYAPGRP